MSDASPQETPAAEAPTRPGRNGGQLRTGNPGNKGGGRTPDAFKAMCRRLASRKGTLRNLRTILDNPNHPKFIAACEFVGDRGYGKPTETKKVKHSGRLVVSFGREGRRGREQ